MAFLQKEQEVALHLLVTKTTIGLLLINERTLDSVAITRLINATVSYDKDGKRLSAIYRGMVRLNRHRDLLHSHLDSKNITEQWNISCCCRTEHWGYTKSRWCTVGIGLRSLRYFCTEKRILFVIYMIDLLSQSSPSQKTSFPMYWSAVEVGNWLRTEEFDPSIIWIFVNVPENEKERLWVL